LEFFWKLVIGTLPAEKIFPISKRPPSDRFPQRYAGRLFVASNNSSSILLLDFASCCAHFGNDIQKSRRIMETIPPACGVSRCLGHDVSEDKQEDKITNQSE
jgi:hypothetical protein